MGMNKSTIQVGKVLNSVIHFISINRTIQKKNRRTTAMRHWREVKQESQSTHQARISSTAVQAALATMAELQPGHDAASRYRR
jgi:hypothetical protein